MRNIDVKQELQILCGEYLIDMGVALENNQVIDCLISMREAGCDSAYRGFRNILVQILENEF